MVMIALLFLALLLSCVCQQTYALSTYWQDYACPPWPKDEGTLQCIANTLVAWTTNYHSIRPYYERLDNLIEMVPDWNSDEVQEIAQSLAAIDRFLCAIRFMDGGCFSGPASVVVEYYCSKLYENPLLSPLECGDFFEHRDRVNAVFDRLHHLLLKSTGKATPPFVDIILQSSLTRTAWNIGADLLNHEECPGDIASCLLSRGWAGVVVEPSDSQAEKLRQRYSSRTDVVTLSQFITPGNALAVFRDAMWNNLILRGQNVTFLKIDIDNGDCDVLAALLRGPWHPQIIYAEFWEVIPPPFAYNHPWHEWNNVTGSLDKYKYYGSVYDWVGRSCSAQALFDMLVEKYGLLTIDECTNGVFLRYDVAQKLDLELVPAAQFEDYWHRYHRNRACWMNSHVRDAFTIDYNILLDRTTPVEEREELLRQHFEVAKGPSTEVGWTLKLR